MYGPPRFSAPTVSVVTKSGGMAKVLPCIARKSAEKVGTILPLSYQPLITCTYSDIQHRSVLYPVQYIWPPLGARHHESDTKYN